MGQGKRKKYSKEIEAAWYALNGFFSTYDYVIRYIDKDGQKQIITPNPNCVLASQISKNGLLKPQRITKSDLIDHFNRDVIIFYKSLPNSRLTTGYGRYDSDAVALSFSAELEITTKKTTDPQYYVMLLGIDIDCHNGERHVREVEELIKKYFPNTYWEDSTNGKGRHGYLKIKFLKSFGVMNIITDCLIKLFARLNELKNLYGYEALIDDPAGLPYKLENTDNNPYIDNWTTLFYTSDKKEKFLGKFINPKSKIFKDYISYLRNNTVNHISEICYTFPSKLSEYLSLDDIRTTYSRFLSENRISFPAPTKNNKYYKITYRRVFKLPMFGTTTSDYSDALPRIDCIKQFHDLPYYTSSDLYSVYHQILEDIQVLKTTSSVYLHYTDSYNLSSGSLDEVPNVGINTSSSDSDLDLFSGPIPVKGGVKTISIQTTKKNSNIEIVNNLPKKSKKETLGNNCACTNTQNRGKISIENFQDETEDNPTYAEIIDWSEFVGNNEGNFEIDIFWDNYKQSKSRSSGNTYKEKLELARVENNPMKRTSLFVCAFINKLGRRPSVDEAEDEYVAQGLNRNSQSSTLNRRKRIKGCIAYYSQSSHKSVNSTLQPDLL